jgi:hypothetical protein
VDFSNEDDCRECIFSFLTPEIRYFLLFHSEGESGLCSGWHILLHPLACLVLVEVELNIVIRHPSCLERMFTLSKNVHGVEFDEVTFKSLQKSQFKLVQGASSENFAVHQYKKRLFPG